MSVRAGDRRRGTCPGDYCAVRSRTEALAAPLGPEDQVVQSMPDCSPTKWHRAHTTWFFEEFVLGPHVAGHEPVDPGYRYLFNSYYEAVGARQPRPRRGMITRPTVDQVAEYRRRVDEAILSLIDRLSAHPDPGVSGLIELGLHHEEQHQELLLMDAKHLLFQNPALPAYRRDDGSPCARPVGSALPEPHVDEASRRPGWIAHPGGVVGIGAVSSAGFAFDNESPRHEVLLTPFEMSDRLVTNGEWLAFMDDGGYRRPELWLSDGWAAVHENGWDAPLYWLGSHTGADSAFTLEGVRTLHPEDPVTHVSYYEADAFARWAGHRLPTESEWESVAIDRWIDDVDAHADPLQLAGEAWQWTASAYLPYPGFRTAPGAVGEYNGKFMVNQHVLRGGSCATPRGHTRVTYRNFFPAAARWQFAGLRLARDA